MDLSPLIQIAPLVGTIVSVAMMLYAFLEVRKTKDDVFDYIDGTVVKLTEFYATEKQDIIENGPKIIASAFHAPVMSQLGKMSGISRQMKGLEGDLIADGVSQATGNPALGPLVAKYAQKYPIIMQLLPMLGKGRGAQQPTGGNGGVGYT